MATAALVYTFASSAATDDQNRAYRSEYEPVQLPRTAAVSPTQSPSPPRSRPIPCPGRSHSLQRLGGGGGGNPRNR